MLRCQIILFWLLNDPVTSLTGLFDRGVGVAHVEMRIHPMPQLLSAPARFSHPHRLFRRKTPTLFDSSITNQSL
jgi:hypothetical protein